MIQSVPTQSKSSPSSKASYIDVFYISSINSPSSHSESLGMWSSYCLDSRSWLSESNGVKLHLFLTSSTFPDVILGFSGIEVNWAVRRCEGGLWQPDGIRSIKASGCITNHLTAAKGEKFTLVKYVWIFGCWAGTRWQHILSSHVWTVDVSVHPLFI